jgi:hypothetical protein
LSPSPSPSSGIIYRSSVSPSPSPEIPPIPGIFTQPILFANRDVVNRELVIGGGASVMTGYRRIPSWNTLGRPKNPKPGIFGFNLQTSNLEYWTGSKWLKLPMRRIK